MHKFIILNFLNKKNNWIFNVLDNTSKGNTKTVGVHSKAKIQKYSK